MTPSWLGLSIMPQLVPVPMSVCVSCVCCLLPAGSPPCRQARWLPELQRVVGVINSSFSTNFSEIGCAGEVLLEQHEDYDKFSIQVCVCGGWGGGSGHKGLGGKGG